MLQKSPADLPDFFAAQGQVLAEGAMPERG